MPRILITGAQGFTGRYLAAHWLSQDLNAEVIGIGRSPQSSDYFTHKVRWRKTLVSPPLLAATRQALASPHYRYVALDLHQQSILADLLSSNPPDIIVHLAASLRDDPSEQLFRNNVIGTEALFTAIAAAQITPPRVIVASSGSVYGIVATTELPVREHTFCTPIDPYSISKRAAEDMAKILAKRYCIPTLYGRIFNIVGPGQDERHVCGWLASQLAPIALGWEPPRIEVSPLVTTRDFIDVRDVASALYVLAQAGQAGETYNIASGRETPIQSIFDDLVCIAGLEGQVQIVRLPARPADMPRHYADISKLKQIGFELFYPLEQSLRDVYNYYAETLASEPQTQEV